MGRLLWCVSGEGWVRSVWRAVYRVVQCLVQSCAESLRSKMRCRPRALRLRVCGCLCVSECVCVCAARRCAASTLRQHSCDAFSSAPSLPFFAQFRCGCPHRLFSTPSLSSGGTCSTCSTCGTSGTGGYETSTHLLSRRGTPPVYSSLSNHLRACTHARMHVRTRFAYTCT